MKNRVVKVEFSNDEALVLFEYLARTNENTTEDQFDDQAEQRVLWDLECILKKQLTEPLLSNYDQLLSEARSKIRDPKEKE